MQRAWLGASIGSPVASTIQGVDLQAAWDDADLLVALNRYEGHLSDRSLSPVTVDSDVRYCGFFLRWRTGDYVPRACPTPIRRPVPAGKRDLAGLRRELEQYGGFLPGGVKLTAVPTYVGPPRRFLSWLGDGPATGPVQAIPQRMPRRSAAAIPSPRSAGLADAFAGTRDGHRRAIIRTVVRMTLLPSVTRVFKTGTAKALANLLLSLPVDELPGLPDQSDYRRWFEAALDLVATTILDNNPPGPQSRVHPGYRWGHGTKVLSLFVRNLVLCSRYFTDDEARRIEWWLYCPIDTVVMRGLRRARFDPRVNQINQIDEVAFWRIQDALSIAARDAGAPRVWFDDVWSEARD